LISMPSPGPCLYNLGTRTEPTHTGIQSASWSCMLRTWGSSRVSVHAGASYIIFTLSHVHWLLQPTPLQQPPRSPHSRHDDKTTIKPSPTQKPSDMSISVCRSGYGGGTVKVTLIPFLLRDKGGDKDSGAIPTASTSNDDIITASGPPPGKPLLHAQQDP
jgi:hypothetical protein